MAWLFKKFKKKGGFVYHIAHRVKKGNKYVIHSKTTGTDKKKLANKKLLKFEEEQSNYSDLRRIYLIDFLEKFENYSKIQIMKEQKAEKTYKLEKGCLEKLLENYGNFYLDSFTSEMVHDYKETRLDYVKPTSVNIELRTLRSVFNYASRKKYIKNNPFSRFEKAKEESDGLPVFMKVDEINKFLSIIESCNDYKFLDYVKFLLHTGARRTEALHIYKEHIDYERKRITLVKTKTRKPRFVPIDNIVERIIKDLPEDEERLFNYRPDTVTHKFKKYLRIAGLPENYSLKTTRKTFASHLVMEGIDLSTVQELLGHASPETTRKHYAKLADEHLQKSVKKLPYK